MKIQEANYITIQGWMRTQLALKGNELLVFALIFGFCQDGSSWFTGSVSYIQDWTGLSDEGVRNTLKSLVGKGYLEKETGYISGIPFAKYRAPQKIWGVAKNFGEGSQVCWGGVAKNFGEGSQKIWDNNNRDNNNRDNNININSQGRKCFVPPMVEDVAAYCAERKNGIDAEEFVAFYASKGWMVGKNKMKDWKQAVITWEKSRKHSTTQPNTPTPGLRRTPSPSQVSTAANDYWDR